MGTATMKPDMQAVEDQVPAFLANQINLNTRGTYGRALERFFNWCRTNQMNPGRMTFEQAVGYRDDVAAAFAEATAALHISALKSFFKTLKEIGILQINVWTVVKAPSAPRTSRTQPLDEDQLRQLYAKAEASGPRDLIIVRMLYEAGMRREEVAKFPKAGVLHTQDGWALSIKGKGDQDIRVGISEDLAHAMLEQAERSEGDYLFPGRDSKENEGKHLDKRNINLILEKFGVHPQQLRHSLVTNLLRQGETIEDVSRALRHESLQTTMRYYDEIQRAKICSLRKS
jgi:integrase/recombinase XerC